MKGGTTIELASISEELLALANSGTRVPGFRKKVMVDTDRLAAIGAQLRDSLPAYFQEAREILRQKDSIVNLAYLEAKRLKEATEHETATMMADAQREHASRVDEAEVVRAAQQRSEQIVAQANQDGERIVHEAQRRAYQMLQEAEAAANARREGSDQYAREVLFSLEERLSEILGQIRRGIDVLGLESRDRVPA